jgi:hypothetical protein
MVDQLTDSSLSKLRFLSKLYELPDFVKQAALPSSDEYRELPSTVFADLRNRRYPIDTKAATWLSKAYFNHFKEGHSPAQESEISTRLGEAFLFWGLDALEKQARDPELLRVQQDGPDKTAAWNIEYILKGEKLAESAVSTPEDLNKVAEDLLQHRNKYPYEMRCNVSRQILGAPEGLRTRIMPDTEQQLHKMAGLGLSTLADTMETLRERAVIYQQRFPEFTEKLGSIKDCVASSERRGIIPPDMLHKLAGLLDAMDRLAGLHARWSNKGFEPPENHLFRFTQKDADSFKKEAICLANGWAVLKQDLHSVDTAGFLGDYFGEQYDSSEKLYGKVASLNSKESDLLLQFIKEARLEALQP